MKVRERDLLHLARKHGWAVALGNTATLRMTKGRDGIEFQIAANGEMRSASKNGRRIHASGLRNIADLFKEGKK